MLGLYLNAVMMEFVGMTENQYDKDTFQLEVGLRILGMRKREGYTREEFAELIGISAKHLYDIEKGKKGFSAFVLYRISRILNVDCNYILEGI